MNLRMLTLGLCVLAIGLAAVAAYLTQTWTPLLMAGPIAIVAAINWPATRK